MRSTKICTNQLLMTFFIPLVCDLLFGGLANVPIITHALCNRSDVMRLGS